MATRSLNKVLLIGNLTRDPELRYTPAGTAVCTFGVATNRQWTTDDGGKKEEAEFHTIVAWNRLAEIVVEYLHKGSQVYVEGRISTREWEAQDGTKRRTTEVVANEVIFLGGPARATSDLDVPADFGVGVDEAPVAEKKDESASNEKATTGSGGVNKGGVKRQGSAQEDSQEGEEEIPF